jgi:voltage-gated potassium channel
MFVIRTLKAFLKDKEYRELLFTTSLVLSGGSVAYHYIEGWSWIDSVYFSVVTLTTVGFGDFAPQTDAGKLFTIFYITIGIGIILSFINALYQHYKNMRS